MGHQASGMDEVEEGNNGAIELGWSLRGQDCLSLQVWVRLKGAEGGWDGNALWWIGMYTGFEGLG